MLSILVAFNVEEYNIEGELGTKGANALNDIVIRAEICKRRCLVFEIPFEILEDGFVVSIYRKGGCLSNPWVCSRKLC
jgi:hypothetical protein